MTEQQDARQLLDRAERAAAAGDLVAAAELLRGAARIQEEELGPLHPDLANTLNNLAIVAERTGSAGEAEALYRRAAAIAAAALPADHPMVVDSRQNLEDFCRARGLPIDAPAAIPAAPNSERDEHTAASKQTTVVKTVPVPPAGITAKPVPQPAAVPKPETPAPIAARPMPPLPTAVAASHALKWVATGVVVLVAAVLLALRPWSSREAPSPPPTPEPSARPAEIVPPPVVEASKPSPSKQTKPSSGASARGDRNVADDKTSGTDGVTVVAQICRTFSSSGGSWRCDPAGPSSAPGPIVFYTRIKSPRDTTVVHRWYRGDTLRQSVTLRIPANATAGYRTFSRLTVNDGDWRLEVRSSDGRLLHEEWLSVR